MSGSLTLSGLWRPWSPAWAPCTRWSWTQRIRHNFPETWRDRQRHRRPNRCHGNTWRKCSLVHWSKCVGKDFKKESKEEKCRIVGWHMTEGMRLWGVTYMDMETLGKLSADSVYIVLSLSWLCWPQNNNTSHIFTDFIDLMGTLMVWLRHTGLKGGSLKKEGNLDSSAQPAGGLQQRAVTELQW